MTFDSKSDAKETAILTAAFDAFARYGLRRTSMQDIAKGAGMSRAALYLRFAGKEDIFRALARHHFTAAKADIEQALARKASVADTLLAVFVALDGQVSEAMMTSPHAEELIDNKSAFIDAQVALWPAPDDQLTHHGKLQHFARVPKGHAELVAIIKIGGAPPPPGWQFLEDCLKAQRGIDQPLQPGG